MGLLRDIYSVESARRVTISWTAFGGLAAECLSAAIDDHDSAVADRLTRPLATFDDVALLQGPSVDVSMLVVSSDRPSSVDILQRFLHTPSASRGSDENARDVRPIRLAWLLQRGDGISLTSVAQALLEHGFTVFGDVGQGQLAVRGAMLGIVGALWTPGLVCVDFMDILTLLTRRRGMTGGVVTGYESGIAAALRRRIGGQRQCRTGGVLVTIFGDSALTMETVERINLAVAGLIPGNWDAKCFVLPRPEGDAWLDGRSHRAIVLWSQERDLDALTCSKVADAPVC